MRLHDFAPFPWPDKDPLIAAISRHFTEQIAESRAHAETLHKLSPEQKKQHLRDHAGSLRQSGRERVRLRERHTAWESGVHDLLREMRGGSFSAEEAVYLFIDG